FELVHEMRTRIIKSPAFDAEHIIGAILFEESMDSKIDGKYTPEFLSDEKGIVQLFKVDRGLAEEVDGSQLMKPITDLDELLKRANEHNIFGTKMRSVSKGCNREAIKEVVEQQFVIGKQIIDAGLVPIMEPEVDIHSEDKSEIETVMKDDILNELNKLSEDQLVMLKLTLPTEANLFKELVDHQNVIRVVALSGGYSKDVDNNKLKENDSISTTFSP